MSVPRKLSRSSFFHAANVRDRDVGDVLHRVEIQVLNISRFFSFSIPASLTSEKDRSSVRSVGMAAIGSRSASVTHPNGSFTAVTRDPESFSM